MSRWVRLVALGILVGQASLSGCAASTPRGASQPDGACPSTAGAGVALPRFVEVRVEGAEVSVGGQRLSSERLAQRLKAEARDTRNQGAALTLPFDVQPEEASSWVSLLLSAGFSHVVVTRESAASGRTVVAAEKAPVLPETDLSSGKGPRLDAVTENAGTEAPQLEVPPKSAVAVPAMAGARDDAASVTPPAAPPKVEVKQMGLHIGGGPNTEEEIARYLAPIQRRFPEFRACYAFAKGTRKAASFGVDLYVSGRGGRATIRDFRTVLTGKEFLACMIDIFGTVEFEKPARATVISYSLLFKPL